MRSRMKLLTTAVLLAALARHASAQTQGTYAFTNVNVVPMTSETVLADQTVLCRNCARWFRRSPSAIRARGLPAG